MGNEEGKSFESWKEKLINFWSKLRGIFSLVLQQGVNYRVQGLEQHQPRKRGLYKLMINISEENTYFSLKTGPLHLQAL